MLAPGYRGIRTLNPNWREAGEVKWVKSEDGHFVKSLDQPLTEGQKEIRDAILGTGNSK